MSEQHATHVILVPGFWLGAWAWNEVVDELCTASDLIPHGVTPLGLNDSDGTSAGGVTLDDRIDDVVELVDRLADGGATRMVIVGHSGGGAVAQGVVDRRPDAIDRVIYVDSGPLADGTPMAAMTVDPPADVEAIPLPDWSQWEEQAGALDGLDDDMLAEFRRRALSEPAGVARSTVVVHNPARLDVPATVICTSIPSEQLRQLIAAGHLPSEITQVKDVTYLDLPTGHWPMFSRPSDLAALILGEARREGDPVP